MYQLALKCCNLRVDHAMDVQFAAAGEGEVCRGVCEGFWVGGVFEGRK
jgi:hypothetical protein